MTVRRLNWRILALIACSKLGVLLIIVLAYRSFPFNLAAYYGNMHYPVIGRISLATAFKTWDAQHYLYLSRAWYAPRRPSDAFFPLLPVLIAAVAAVVRDPLIAGLLASNVASGLAVYYLYLLGMLLYRDRATAETAVLLLVVFPTAFFLCLVYSESLFLLLAVTFFYNLYRQRYGACAVAAFLLPLVRPTGIFILIPCLMHHWLARHVLPGEAGEARIAGGGPPMRRVQRFLSRPVRERRYLLPAQNPSPGGALHLAAPLAGYALYLVLMYTSTGDPFTGIREASRFVSAWHVANALHPAIFIGNLFYPLTHAHVAIDSFTYSPLDRIFFVLFLIGLPVVYAQTDLVLFSFYVLTGCVPVFGPFMSYMRYLMPAFPLYLAFARLLASRGPARPLVVPWVALSAVACIVLLARHALNYWVA